MCGTIREYHEKLLSGRVKRIFLISKNLMQVEMKCDRSIDGRNRENNNSGSGLGGRNTIVWAFVTTAVRDLIYSSYLSNQSSNILQHRICQSYDPINYCILILAIYLVMILIFVLKWYCAMSFECGTK